MSKFKQIKPHKRRKKAKVGGKHQSQLREFSQDRPLTMMVEEGDVDFDGSPYVATKRFYIVALRGRLIDLQRPSAEAALNKISQEECPFPTDINDDNHFRFRNSRVAVRPRNEADNALLRDYAGQVVKDDITTAVADEFSAAMDDHDERTGKSGRNKRILVKQEEPDDE